MPGPVVPSIDADVEHIMNIVKAQSKKSRPRPANRAVFGRKWDQSTGYSRRRLNCLPVIPLVQIPDAIQSVSIR
jgi:hypothetical protein